jgi:hypothetical protein
MAEVRFLGCDNDVFCANVQARATEFEQASGHKLTVRLLDNDFYYANQLTDYLDGGARRMSTCPGRCWYGSSSAWGSSARSTSSPGGRPLTCPTSSTG